MELKPTHFEIPGHADQKVRFWLHRCNQVVTTSSYVYEEFFERARTPVQYWLALFLVDVVKLD